MTSLTRYIFINSVYQRSHQRPGAQVFLNAPTFHKHQTFPLIAVHFRTDRLSLLEEAETVDELNVELHSVQVNEDEEALQRWRVFPLGAQDLLLVLLWVYQCLECLHQELIIVNFGIKVTVFLFEGKDSLWRICWISKPYCLNHPKCWRRPESSSSPKRKSTPSTTFCTGS